MVRADIAVQLAGEATALIRARSGSSLPDWTNRLSGVAVEHLEAGRFEPAFDQSNISLPIPVIELASAGL